MGLHNIFPTSIYTHFIPQDIANKLEKIVIPRLNLLKYDGDVNTDYFEQDKIVSSNEIQPFLDYVKFMVDLYSQESNIACRIMEDFWIQDYSQFHQHKSHCHPNARISGTYYIRTNDQAGELLFYHPNPHVSMQMDRYPLKRDKFYPIKPQKGLLVLFPSWLQHEILPSPNKEVIRTSFSFNCK